MVRRAIPMIALVVALVAAREARADDCLTYRTAARCRPPKRVGVGLAVFAPGGVTLEGVVTRKVRLDLAGGRDKFLDQRLTAHGAVTYSLIIPNIGTLLLPVYVGVGGGWIDQAGAVIRLPFGLRGETAVQSFQMYFEGAVRIPTGGDDRLGAEGAIGFRYFLL